MFRKSVGALALAGMILAAAVPAASAASVVVPPSRSSGTIVEIAVANGSFKTLVAAVGCADPAVAAALTSGEQLTVFAPTDAAFGELGLTAGNVCGAFSQATLTKILLYHVETGRHFSNSVLPRKAGQAKSIDTLLGQSFTVNSTGTITTKSGATTPHIIAANIPATNGVIHVVDAVLVPSL
jgi:transforming growth factor-beta-induced protein